MRIRAGNGYKQVGRIDEQGNVFDKNGYDTGEKIAILGVPIRDSYGRIEPGASVDRGGTVRDNCGRCMPGYTRLEND